MFFFKEVTKITDKKNIFVIITPKTLQLVSRVQLNMASLWESKKKSHPFILRAELF